MIVMTAFKKVASKIYHLGKLPFSSAKTSLIKSQFNPLSDVNVRSASDNGAYPELALKAALDVGTFSIFRRHSSYTPILEHVSRKQGEAYLEIIQNKYSLKEGQILEIIEPLQSIGSPRLCRLSGLASKVSTTALRYLKVALDIKERFGSDLGDVAEIGCGYGGQAVILDRVVNLSSYTFFDLWQVNLLITRFIEASPLTCSYEVRTLRSLNFQKSAWRLAISNYALSELPVFLQERYYENVLRQSSNGYLTMNSGVNGLFGGIPNYSQEKWLGLLDGSSVDEEVPLTGPNNYILSW